MRLKHCPRCDTDKPTVDFNRNRTKPDGLSAWCRACRSKYHLDSGRGRKEWERIKADPELRKRQAAAQRKTRLKQRYGLTEAQFDALLEAQGGRCVLCRSKPDYRLFVDHDHESGKTRGLLCAKCNGALGWLENNKARVFAYLDWTRELQWHRLLEEADCMDGGQDHGDYVTQVVNRMPD